MENVITDIIKLFPTCQERRMDALCRLLEGSSICVSLIVLSESIFIVYNKFTKTTKNDNIQYKFIIDLMIYFKKIALSNKPPDNTDKLAIIKLILSTGSLDWPQRFNKKKRNSLIDIIFMLYSSKSNFT
jgi:hypothetical protein